MEETTSGRFFGELTKRGPPLTTSPKGLSRGSGKGGGSARGSMGKEGEESQHGEKNAGGGSCSPPCRQHVPHSSIGRGNTAGVGDGTSGIVGDCTRHEHSTAATSASPAHALPASSTWDSSSWDHADGGGSSNQLPSTTAGTTGTTSMTNRAANSAKYNSHLHHQLLWNDDRTWDWDSVRLLVQLNVNPSPYGMPCGQRKPAIEEQSLCEGRPRNSSIDDGDLGRRQSLSPGGSAMRLGGTSLGPAEGGRNNAGLGQALGANDVSLSRQYSINDTGQGRGGGQGILGSEVVGSDMGVVAVGGRGDEEVLKEQLQQQRQQKQQQQQEVMHSSCTAGPSFLNRSSEISSAEVGEAVGKEIVIVMGGSGAAGGTRESFLVDTPPSISGADELATDRSMVAIMNTESGGKQRRRALAGRSGEDTAAGGANLRVGKRSRSGSMGGGTVAMCQVEGCRADLSNSKEYHRRHKICQEHSKTPEVFCKGELQRFCQQCSRFHPLSAFDEGKRSCKMRLIGHNLRRRKATDANPCLGSQASLRAQSPAHNAMAIGRLNSAAENLRAVDGSASGGGGDGGMMDKGSVGERRTSWHLMKSDPSSRLNVLQDRGGASLTVSSSSPAIIPFSAESVGHGVEGRVSERRTSWHLMRPDASESIAMTRSQERAGAAVLSSSSDSATMSTVSGESSSGHHGTGPRMAMPLVGLAGRGWPIRKPSSMPDQGHTPVLRRLLREMAAPMDVDAQGVPVSIASAMQGAAVQSGGNRAAEKEVNPIDRPLSMSTVSHSTGRVPTCTILSAQQQNESQTQPTGLTLQELLARKTQMLQAAVPTLQASISRRPTFVPGKMFPILMMSPGQMGGSSMAGPLEGPQNKGMEGQSLNEVEGPTMKGADRVKAGGLKGLSGRGDEGSGNDPHTGRSVDQSQMNAGLLQGSSEGQRRVLREQGRADGNPGTVRQLQGSIADNNLGTTGTHLGTIRESQSTAEDNLGTIREHQGIVESNPGAIRGEQSGNNPGTMREQLQQKTMRELQGECRPIIDLQNSPPQSCHPPPHPPPSPPSGHSQVSFQGPKSRDSVCNTPS